MHTCLPQFYLLLLLCSFIILSQSVHDKIASNTTQRIPGSLDEQREQPPHAQLRTQIKYVGRARTPVAILDNVLAKTDYLSLRNDLRSRDFLDGKFPGKLAVLDRATVDSLVDSLVDALASNHAVNKHFPREMFEQRDYITGFASILCKTWGLQKGVHHDFIGSTHGAHDGEIKAPAAVFYFGFDGAEVIDGATKIETGTAFYREKISGL